MNYQGFSINLISCNMKSKMKWKRNDSDELKKWKIILLRIFRSFVKNKLQLIFFIRLLVLLILLFIYKRIESNTWQQLDNYCSKENMFWRISHLSIKTGKGKTFKSLNFLKNSWKTIFFISLFLLLSLLLVISVLPILSTILYFGEMDCKILWKL